MLKKKFKSRGGFTLIELLVVVLIVGILAAIAVPQYFRVVEKGRVTEAIAYIQSIKGSEERSMVKSQAYVVASSLDVVPPTLKDFDASAITPNGTTSWAVTLTRKITPPTYGQYTVIYNSAAAMKFTCNNATGQADLMP